MLERLRTKVASLISPEARAGVNLMQEAFYKYLHAGQVQWLFGNKEKIVKDAYLGNDLVYSALRIYLQKVKLAPVTLVKRTGTDAAMAKYKAFSDDSDPVSRVYARQYRKKAVDEVMSHPLLTLMRRPNSYQTTAKFFEAAMGFKKLMGETFIYGVGPGADSVNSGKFTSLHVLPAHLVTIVFSGNPMDPVQGYKFTMGDWTIEIPKEQVLHIADWNPDWDLNGTQLRGVSPATPGNKLITRNNYNLTTQARSYQNGGRVTLLSKGNPDAKLTVEQVGALQAKIQEWFNLDNYKSVIATNGVVNAQTIGDTLADMEMIASADADRTQIATLFGVDPILLGDKSSSSYNNAKEAAIALVSGTVVPDLKEVYEGLNGWLVPAYGDNLMLEPDTSVYPELKPDLKLMREVFGDSVAFTPNELRWALGWDESPDPLLNKHYANAGLVPLDQLNSDQDLDGPLIDEEEQQ